MIHVWTQRNLSYNAEAYTDKFTGDPHAVDITDTEREEITVALGT